MAFWISLAVFLACLAGGIAYVVLRGIALWRALKRTGGRFTAEGERIASLAEQTQPHIDRAEASAERLRAATGRLAVSRARLDVLLQAVREARWMLRQLLRLLPGA
jgi:hypothetical protein